MRCNTNLNGNIAARFDKVLFMLRYIIQYLNVTICLHRQSDIFALCLHHLYTVCTEVPLIHKMPKSQFTWQVKKSVEIEKKALPERKQVQGEKNGTKKRSSAIKRKKS